MSETIARGPGSASKTRAQGQYDDQVYYVNPVPRRAQHSDYSSRTSHGIGESPLQRILSQLFHLHSIFTDYILLHKKATSDNIERYAGRKFAVTLVSSEEAGAADEWRIFNAAAHGHHHRVTLYEHLSCAKNGAAATQVSQKST